ncbi:MAG: hypothetical protein IKP40_00085 [Clostridia bacterium]|nr:hypothetical protein [Clostridia bacterium]
MKKITLLIAAILLCCSLQVTALGYANWDCENYGHRAYCYAPSVCCICGKNIWEIHIDYIEHDYSLHLADKHYHWEACKYW